jgi:predicted neutral ceramidase superfamily lipid hydrolase
MEEVTSTKAGGGVGSGAVAIGGAIASTIVSSLFAKADAKKQRELEEEIAKLSLAQQLELQSHLQTVQGEVQKQKIVYDYLAQKNLQEVEANIKSKRYTAYIVLGGAVLLLAGVIVLSKFKK